MPDGPNPFSLGLARMSSAIPASIGPLILEVLPWFCVWHGLYWLAYAFSPRVFKTVTNLDEHESGEKGFWCSSFVSTVFGVVLTLMSAGTLIVEPHLLDA